MAVHSSSGNIENGCKVGWSTHLEDGFQKVFINLNLRPAWLASMYSSGGLNGGCFRWIGGSYRCLIEVAYHVVKTSKDCPSIPSWDHIGMLYIIISELFSASIINNYSLHQHAPSVGESHLYESWGARHHWLVCAVQCWPKDPTLQRPHRLFVPVMRPYAFQLCIFVTSSILGLPLSPVTPLHSIDVQSTSFDPSISLQRLWSTSIQLRACSMTSGQLPALSADLDDLLSHAIVTCTLSRCFVARPFPCFYYNVVYFLYLPQLGMFHMYHGLSFTPTLVMLVPSPLNICNWLLTHSYHVLCVLY
jgi:hypothetical protein